MKSGLLFWGTLLTASGFLLLAGHAGFFPGEWSFPWEWWPLVLVLLGFARLTAHRPSRSTLVVAAALVTALILVGRPLSILDKDVDGSIVRHQVFAEPAGGEVRAAELRMDLEPGAVTIGDSRADLFRAMTASNLGRFGYTSEREQDSVHIEFYQQPDGQSSGRQENDIDLTLNPDPVWDLSLRIGASDLRADVSGLRVRRLAVEAGAAALELHLGALLPEMDVDISAPASDVTIRIPNNAGCEVRFSGGATNANLEGFTEIGPGLYRTERTGESLIAVTIASDAAIVKVTRE